MIRDYLDRLEKTKYLAPLDPDLEMDDLDELDDPDEDEPWLENPVMVRKSCCASPVSVNFFSRREPWQNQSAIPSARPASMRKSSRMHMDPEEQAMGWYYYLEDKICFPFKAKCISSKVTSPLRKGESVGVQRYGA